MVYYYLVAPGVVCHETGHALGCLLTGTKIAEFVPVKPSSDETLGYVSHELPDGGSFVGNIAQFVISTGPVWFGSAMILGLSYLVRETGLLPNVRTQSLMQNTSMSILTGYAKSPPGEQSPVRPVV